MKVEVTGSSDKKAALRINKAAALAGAKKIKLDVFVDAADAPKKLGKLRVKVVDAAKTNASSETSLAKGANAIEVELTAIDTKKIDNVKFAFDGLDGKITVFVDNVRIVK